MNSHILALLVLLSAASAGARTALSEVGKAALVFEANHGQTAAQYAYVARGHGYTLLLDSGESTLLLGAAKRGTSTLTVTLAGANKDARVIPPAPLPGVSHYLLGPDPAKWLTNIPNYSRIRYQNVYTGIDVAYYGKEGRLEYDFIVAPLASPASIRMRFTGANGMGITADGDLLLRVGSVEVRHHRPLAYQEQAGHRIPRAARFVMQGPGEIGFALGNYDRSKPLVIDPVLTYASFLGGAGIDEARGVAVDGRGNAYVTGWTTSANFPITSGAHQTALAGGSDAFVTRLDATGKTRVYSTYFGGAADDIGEGIAVDATGNAYVTGVTSSSNFPVLGQYQSFGGASDAFVAKFSPSGTLLYSTFLGGSSNDEGHGIAIDASGNAHATGWTSSSNFPVSVSARQTTYGGNTDAFVAKLNPGASGAASLLYSTYLGGSSLDQGFGIAADTAGYAFVTGLTMSTNFPLQNQYQSHGGAADAFVVKLNPAAAGTASMLYSTYLGGTVSDEGRGIAVDAAGLVYVTGGTSSSNFAITPDAYQSSNSFADSDAFLTVLNPALSGASSVTYSTYFGGTASDTGRGVAVDATNNVYLTGETSSGSDFPRLDSVRDYSGAKDAFVAKLNPSRAGAAGLLMSSFLGGAANDAGYGIAVGRPGVIYVAGLTGSANFPATATASQASFGGSFEDAFVAKIVDSHAASLVFRDLYGAVQLGGFADSSLKNASGVFASDPAAARDRSGNTIVTARDTYNAIWANRFVAATQAWAGWTYGGGDTQGIPAVAVAADGVAYIAVRDTWNAYWLTSYTPGAGFGTWTYLAGIFSEDPVMAACADGSVYLIGRDNWRALWSERFVPGSAFPGWQFGGGIIQGKPSVTCGTDNIAHIVVRDDWNSLWLARIQGNSWLNWTYGGGNVSGNPQIAASGDGTVYAVLRDAGGGVWYRGFTEGTTNGWQSWVYTGGTLEALAAAAVNGELFISGRDSGSGLWWYSASRNTWIWADNAGKATGQPTVAPR